MLIQHSPNPHSYAAMRIDHIATVEHFPYPDIMEAARKVQPKTYLVFLNTALSIPFPQDPWFPFTVTPIAPFPPPTEGHLTSEMCIPIYPNTSHPEGRAAVRTEPPFPYDNCYHWSNAREFNVRVRPRQKGYFDDDRELWRMVARDCTKVEEARGRDAPEDVPTIPTDIQPQTPVPLADTVAGSWDVGEGGHPSAPEASSGHEDTVPAPNQEIANVANDGMAAEAQSSANDDAVSDFRALVGMGIFGTRLDNKDDYPLVDVWLELADHLKQEDIPDPRDFYAECDTLVQ
ncbi:hypothetical protein V8D89_008373 [Ganoderma adspersum]